MKSELEIIVSRKTQKHHEYELRLDYSLYNQLTEIKEPLANDIINSLGIISSCRDFKNPQVDLLKNDFGIIFKEMGLF